MLLQMKPSTHNGTHLCCGDYLLLCGESAYWTEARNPAKKQNKTVVVNGSCGLLHLPADSPVLIQSGFAMLAIAKISAARNRHPEMIVSLSISPADEAMNDRGNGGKCGGRCPNVTPSVERHRVGCYQSNLAPFSRSPLLWFRCAFCSNVSSFSSSKREPPATIGSNTTHKSITSQTPVVVQ